MKGILNMEYFNKQLATDLAKDTDKDFDIDGARVYQFLKESAYPDRAIELSEEELHENFSHFSQDEMKRVVKNLVDHRLIDIEAMKETGDTLYILYDDIYNMAHPRAQKDYEMRESEFKALLDNIHEEEEKQQLPFKPMTMSEKVIAQFPRTYKEARLLEVYMERHASDYRLKFIPHLDDTIRQIKYINAEDMQVPTTDDEDTKMIVTEELIKRAVVKIANEMKRFHPKDDDVLITSRIRVLAFDTFNQFLNWKYEGYTKPQFIHTIAQGGLADKDLKNVFIKKNRQTVVVLNCDKI